MNKPIRLDIFLKDYHNIQSRNKAAELIKAKKIKIDGVIITKPSFKIEQTANIEILQDIVYVSRSANKLKYFLEELDNKININGKTALDIGSSTGGFTQILLLNNIKQVDCVDVGSNQLHKSIANNPKITIYENTDIRKFNPQQKYDIITCDVSFISILYIIDDINRLAKQDIIILYKPQYEVGSNIKRDSAGVVKDNNAIKEARNNFLQHTANLQWDLVHNATSKVAGKQGNIEELFYFHKINNENMEKNDARIIK